MYSMPRAASSAMVRRPRHDATTGAIGVRLWSWSCSVPFAMNSYTSTRSPASAQQPSRHTMFLWLARASAVSSELNAVSRSRRRAGRAAAGKESVTRQDRHRPHHDKNTDYPR